MARQVRREKNGFYHVLNRGVARNSVYHDDEDFTKFLEILQDASDDYEFEIYSFCLMPNHYHILIEIKKENLSQIMQKINSRYSMYFNHKYKRVGPLWQGRFKSWFVYDESYLKALVKYIEFNPIKAKITQTIGEYRWAMSSYNFKFLMVNFELIGSIDFNEDISKLEQKNIDSVFSAKLEIKDEDIPKKDMLIDEYFKSSQNRDDAIFDTFKIGFTQTQIAIHLNLSSVAISKILKNYKRKIRLFDKIKDRGIFWSYSKEIVYSSKTENLFVEYLLKYGDFDDIRLGFELFGKRKIFKIWDSKLKSDKQFIKLNLMLARVFFDMDVESDYFKEVKNARFEKLKLLAS